jgi:hypothetical protein
MLTLFPPSRNADSPVSPREIRFERRRVEMLLSKLGLTEDAKELWLDFQRYWGEDYRRLTFQSFDRVFPTFPWQLTAKSFYRMSPYDSSRQSIMTFFTNFERTLIWEWYSGFREQYKQWSRETALEPIPAIERGRPLGMVFPMGGLHGGFIIHNGPAQTLAPRLVYDHQDGHQGEEHVRCHIEPYAH